MLKDKTPIMINEAELLEISRAGITYTSAMLANDLANAWGEQYKDSPFFNLLCKQAFIFEAGRIQGIREERQRRQKNRG